MTLHQPGRIPAVALVFGLVAGACSSDSDAALTDPPSTVSPFAQVEEDAAQLAEAVENLTTLPPVDEAEQVTPSTVKPAPVEIEKPDPVEPVEAAPQVISGVLDLDGIKVLAESVIGPTDDVAATLAGVGVFPSGVPTQPGSAIRSFDASMDHYEDLEVLNHSTRVGVVAPQGFAETMAFYQAELTAAGFTITDLVTQTSGDGDQAGAIFTDAPDEGGFTNRRVNVVVRPVEGGTLAEFVAEAFEPAGNQLDRFRSWAVGAPVPVGGAIRAVSVSVTPFGDRFTGRTDVAWEFANANEADARAEIDQAIANHADYTLTGDINSFSITLASPQFKRADIQVQSGGGQVAVTLGGSWDL